MPRRPGRCPLDVSSSRLRVERSPFLAAILQHRYWTGRAAQRTDGSDLENGDDAETAADDST
jgi:hypothetical protein